MKTTHCVLALGASILCLLFLSLDTAYGQQPSPRSYLFVEVKDETGQMVTGAAVTVSNEGRKQITSEITNKDGVASVSFPPTSDHHYNIQVSKSDYLLSEHVFFSIPGFKNLVAEIPNDHRTQSAVITLRKIPETLAGRQAFEAEERKYRLLLAAKRGDAPSLRKLLQAGVKADTVDAKGVPAIAWAAFAGDPETIKLLLEAGADVRNENTLGHQALLLYLAEGLPREKNTREPEKDSKVGSEKQLIERHEEIVLRLIKAGAGVNTQSSYRGTVLNKAIIQIPDSLSSETVKVLIAAGANVNDVDEGGRTPLMFASQTGSLETIKTLLVAGASINARDKSGQTALMWGQVASRYAGRYNPEVIKTLIGARADVNAVDKSGRTPLMFAAQADLAESVKMLLEAGAKAYINAKDERGETALIYAFNSFYYSTNHLVAHPSLAIVKALIAAGANVNDVNGSGRTPLMLAAQRNSLDAVKILLAAGASIKTKDNKGRTVLMYDPLYNYSPSVEVFKTLMAAGADVNAIDENGQTPLMSAAHSAPIEVIKMLLEAGAEVNAKDKLGRTALMFAFYSSVGSSSTLNKTLVTKALIAAGANVNDVNNDGGLTPLMCAVQQDAPLEIIKMLLEAGAKATISDKWGQTALIYAAYKFNDSILAFNDSRLEVVRLLIAAGGINIKDNQGQTALMIAKKAGHKAMVKLLEEAEPHD